MHRPLATICVTVLFGLSLFASAAGFAAYCPMPECSHCEMVVSTTPAADDCCSVDMDHHATVAPITQPDCDCDLMVDGLDEFGGSATVTKISSPSSPTLAADLAAQSAHSDFAGLSGRHTFRRCSRAPVVSPGHSGTLHSQSVLFLV